MKKKILQIAHKRDPFSVKEWGAIEKLAREYHEVLTHIFEAKTISSAEPVNKIIENFNPDYILIHDEKVALDIIKSETESKAKIQVICHYAYLKEVFGIEKYRLFDRLRQLPFRLRNVITIIRVRRRIKCLLKSGRVKFIVLDPNILKKSIMVKNICVGKNYINEENQKILLRGNGRLICVGNIEPRKRQFELQQLDLPLDFVGPINDPRFDKQYNYLGVVENSNIMNLVRNYDALVLMSEADLMPLVVIEALFVGVPVIINQSFYGPFEETYGVVPINDISKIATINLHCFDRRKIATESKRKFSLQEKRNQLELINLVTD